MKRKRKERASIDTILGRVRMGSGLSREELSPLCGVSPTTLYRYELGGVPPLSVARAIATALEVELEHLWPVADDGGRIS